MFGYTLVPEDFFSKDNAAALLSSIVPTEGQDSVKYMELPQYKAVLIYSGNQERAAQIADMVVYTSCINQYNKVVARVEKDTVDIAVAAGEKLLLCNTYEASDSVTVQYFIFAAIREFQINPELTVLHLYGGAQTALAGELFRHFKSVETI